MGEKNINLLYFFLLFGILVGCQSSTDSVKEGSPQPIENRPTQSLKPLPISEELFLSVYGWFDSQTIIYSYVEQDLFYLATHNIFDGKKQILFTTNFPIIDVGIHQQKQQIFIHTSQNPNYATLYFISSEGDILYSTTVESNELVYEWNPYHSDKILLTTFYEDWTYDSFLLDLSQQSIHQIYGLQPFVQWISTDEILELDWDINTTQISAPLIKKSITNPNNGETLYENIYRFDVLGDYLLTIDISEIDSEIHYHFSSRRKKDQSTITIPSIAKNGEWLIPFYDLLPFNQTFVSFVPNKHTNIDDNQERFQLIRYDLTKNHSEIIGTHLENKPLSCSPDGFHCLYGYLIESIINMENGKIFNLISF